MSELTIRSLEDQAAQELARSVKRRAARLSCSGCGQRDFALLEDPGAHMRSLIRREAVPTGSTPFSVSQVVATLVCTNCGHLVQFADAVLSGVKPDDFGAKIRDE